MTSIVIQGLYYLMQRMLNSILLHPVYDRRVPAEEANNNELMWSGFEGEKKKQDKGALREEINVIAHFDLAFKFSLNAEWNSPPPPWLSISERMECWPVGRYSMAIISVKSNKNQAWKGNKPIFLRLCIVLQIYSVLISYYLVIFTKKNMWPLHSTFSFISAQIAMSSYGN